MELAKTATKRTNKKDSSYREQLISEYLPYVKRIVHRLAMNLPSTIDIDELLNVGVIGLIQAVDRYDPKRDNKFMTYAVFRIKGAVLSELRSRDFLSRSNRRKMRELESAYLRLEQKLGREVEDMEVAEELGVDIEQIYRTKQLSNISFISLEELGYSSKDEKEKLINFLVNNNEDALTLTRLKELKNALAKAIEELPEKERLVISLYYLDDLTMKETGEVLGITESRVSQIHSQAVIHLRAKLRKQKLLEN
ncbi:MAG: FliA/WhiG family RNA polymerase sigma factor [Desulfobacterales bacterium]|jgi:RNA polymerase sigma factor for flagellar operon FliA|nr:MAG: FliA/WhiG family RNA polymerase sigma factor [Desulfobacterales bacterium]